MFSHSQVAGALRWSFLVMSSGWTGVGLEGTKACCVGFFWSFLEMEGQVVEQLQNLIACIVIDMVFPILPAYGSSKY
ncbi:hypothetical protein V6N13_136067 [Hibiscus sabdariffa]